VRDELHLSKDRLWARFAEAKAKGYLGDKEPVRIDYPVQVLRPHESPLRSERRPAVPLHTPVHVGPTNSLDDSQAAGDGAYVLKHRPFPPRSA